MGVKWNKEIWVEFNSKRWVELVTVIQIGPEMLHRIGNGRQHKNDDAGDTLASTKLSCFRQVPDVETVIAVIVKTAEMTMEDT